MLAQVIKEGSLSNCRDAVAIIRSRAFLGPLKAGDDEQLTTSSLLAWVPVSDSIYVCVWVHVLQQFVYGFAYTWWSQLVWICANVGISTGASEMRVGQAVPHSLDLGVIGKVLSDTIDSNTWRRHIAKDMFCTCLQVENLRVQVHQEWMDAHSDCSADELVNEYVIFNAEWINEEAEGILRSLELDLLWRIIAQGSLRGVRDPVAIIKCRIRDAKSGKGKSKGKGKQAEARAEREKAKAE